MGKLLTANEIIAAKDRREERIEVPEWGGEVILRGLSVRARGWIARRASDLAAKDGSGLGPEEGIAILLSRAIVDEDGNELFDEKQLLGLAEKSGEVMQRLYDRALEISGLHPRVLEITEKNSGAAPSGGSSSD